MINGDMLHRTPRSLQMSRERDQLSIDEKVAVADHLSVALGGLTRRRRLDVLESGSMGAKDSAHDVFFVATSQEKQKPAVTFACKRFRRGDDAERELLGIHSAKERGFRTLEPAGDEPIQTVPGVGHVLVTKRLPRFATMNQMGWHDHYAGEPDYEAELSAPLEQAAKFTGNMHRHGITHGDLQLKNIGQIPPGKFVLFDLEGARFHEPDSVHDDPDFHGQAVEDVGTLVSSLVDRGYMWHSSDSTFAKEVSKHVLDPYLDVSGATNPDIIDGLSSVIDEGLIRRVKTHQEIAQRTFPKV